MGPFQFQDGIYKLHEFSKWCLLTGVSHGVQLWHKQVFFAEWEKEKHCDGIIQQIFQIVKLYQKTYRADCASADRSVICILTYTSPVLFKVKKLDTTPAIILNSNCLESPLSRAIYIYIQFPLWSLRVWNSGGLLYTSIEISLNKWVWNDFPYLIINYKTIRNFWSVLASASWYPYIILDLLTLSQTWPKNRYTDWRLRGYPQCNNHSWRHQPPMQ